MNLKPELLRDYAHGYICQCCASYETLVVLNVPLPAVRYSYGQRSRCHRTGAVGRGSVVIITFSTKVLVSVRRTQALILVPTRDLAQQIQNVVITLGDYMNMDAMPEWARVA